MKLLKLLLRNKGRDPLGTRGEEQAARHLRKQGYRILARNLRSRLGEIDLLCEDPSGKTLVIVEVKTRSEGDILPEANVTAAKKRKLIALAQSLGGKREYRDRPLRIDVVSVLLPDSGKATIRHHENAVTL